MPTGPASFSTSEPSAARCRLHMALFRCAPFVVLAGLIVVAALPAVAVTEPKDDAARVRLPKNELFADVKDKLPLATIDSNFLEYSACKLVLAHAKTLTAELLAMHAKPAGSYADLIGDGRADYLRELLHVEGKLVRIRERDGRDLLGDKDEAKLYEGWLQFNNDPDSLICIMFTRLPEEMAVGDKVDYRVTFDGYYFKLLGYKAQGKDPNGKEVWRTAPLLIGIEPAKFKAPPADPDAKSFEQVQLPKVGVKYAAIVDGKPMATAIDNRHEWAAYQAIIAHASRVPLKALQRHARPNVSFSELREPRREEGPGYENFLRQLLQIRGRLIDLQRVDLPEPLPGTNLKEIYEGWMYHEGAPGDAIKFVVAELPHGFKIGESVNEAITLEGYYFKRANFSGEKMGDRPAPKYAPVLIGRSFRIRSLEAPPAIAAQTEAEQVQLPTSEFYSDIKDRVPLASELSNYWEYLAYNDVFSHMRKLTPEAMARHSRRDVVYADLINDIRREYLRKLIHVEGRIVRIRERNATDYLRHSDTEIIYDAWLYHDNHRENPINIAFTQLPEGMELGERVSYQVTVDGYYFKLIAYESNEKDEKGKKVWRVAPLLVAITPNMVGERSRDGFSMSGLAPWVLGGIGLVVLTAVGLAIWFRRDDRRNRDKVRETMLTRNPFDETPETGPSPAIQPGSAWEQVAESTAAARS